VTQVLRDVLAPGLRVVFCGTAAGTASAKARAYYAGPGNAFWRTLHSIGLTPEQLAPAEFERLPEFGIGLTDICKVLYGSDAEVGTVEFDARRAAGEDRGGGTRQPRLQRQERRPRRPRTRRRLRAAAGAGRRRGGMGAAVDVRGSATVLDGRAVAKAGPSLHMRG
jgi:hypothetical protein